MKSEKIFPLPHWVPNGILNGYSEMGIIGLFEWQANLLNEAIDGNLVYSAPTSAGKSIVAELIALRMAISGRKIIFILPYISVAKEKLLFLQRLWRHADLEITGFIGHQSTPPHEWTAAVCTIEKANSLLNHALLDGNFHQIGGSLKNTIQCGVPPDSFDFRVSRDHEKIIRIIGMSTTTQNIHEIGNWINAKVALEIAKILDSLYKSDEKLLSRLNKSALWKMKMKMEQTCALDPVLAKTLPRGVGIHHGGKFDEVNLINLIFEIF
uniref:DEAD/DEAH box helicase n=1 Tax=Heterorhabditis bacteriophora TaxID=37862 RepID=A0A1I7WUV4_HETBA